MMGLSMPRFARQPRHWARTQVWELATNSLGISRFIRSSSDAGENELMFTGRIALHPGDGEDSNPPPRSTAMNRGAFPRPVS